VDTSKDTVPEHEVTGRVTGEVTGEVTGTVSPGEDDGPVPGFSALRDEDPQREGTSRDPFSPDDPRRAGPGDPGEDEDLHDENGLPLTEEEKAERRKPVAAVPASVSMDEIEAVEGFRLPRDQPEAEQARRLAEQEAEDASRPEVAQQLADEARGRAEQAAEEAEAAQRRADEVKAAYDGPDRPPLHLGWRYRKPEPDVHDPA
jgi:hypothetical protein